MKTPTTLRIDDVEYVRKDQISAPAPLSDEVIIRTQYAGVHIGTVESRSGSELVLLNARRLWKWSGAFTLNEVSLTGVKRSDSRISAPVQKITLLGVLEILPVTTGVDLTTTEK